MLIKIIDNISFQSIQYPWGLSVNVNYTLLKTGRPSVKADACNNKELLQTFSTEHGFEFLPDLNAKLS